ncbi:MAG: hypothetical protein COA44_06775 [Arcobacter sp.]|nr:MAG: hypothetical protein COA44_06775 [Arcobacter sp.]
MIKYLISTLLLGSIGLIACPMDAECDNKEKASCHEKCKKECPKESEAKTCPHKDGTQKKENCNYHQSKAIQK